MTPIHGRGGHSFAGQAQISGWRKAVASAPASPSGMRWLVRREAAARGPVAGGIGATWPSVGPVAVGGLLVGTVICRRHHLYAAAGCGAWREVAISRSGSARDGSGFWGYWNRPAI
ncbi:MAG: hypothetical protein LBJ02_08535 [Bifidobacteriaceae bacterium]|jgi:hypothetical protein|nr:hypothetical protein [Bifidobacteriaceae bacterium]